MRKRSLIENIEAGGIMAKLLLPIAFLLPVTVSWFRAKAQYLGYLNFEQGHVIMVALATIPLCLLTMIYIKTVNKFTLERKQFVEIEKQARHAAELEKEKLHSLFLQAPAIISITRGPDHVFELFNNEARKTISGRDITGLSIRQGLPELEGMGFFEALDEAYRSGNPIILQESPADLKQADGTYVKHYFNVVYQPWRNPSGIIAGILNVSIDVTEPVLARKKVEEALKARDEFISIASHELRTPLTSLKLQVQMTKKGIDPALGVIPPGDTLKKAFELIERQVNRLTVLVQDMLDINRIQTGKLALELKPVHLSALIKDVVEQFAEYLATAKNSISIEVGEEFTGLWDRYRLEQVLANLITNAAIYAPGSAIEVTAKKKDNMVEVCVHDHGPGISKINQAKLFQRFERAGMSINISGLGIGLFISKHIIEAHLGTIRVESEVGQGASFIFALPLSQ